MELTIASSFVGGAFQIWSSKARGALEGTVLIENNARRHKARPRQIVGKSARCVCDIRRDASWQTLYSVQVATVFQVPRKDFKELRVDLGAPDRQACDRRPQDDPEEPKLKPIPTAAASVPFTIATERGAPPRESAQ